VTNLRDVVGNANAAVELLRLETERQRFAVMLRKPVRAEITGRCMG
jgi:hypothetical protein